MKTTRIISVQVTPINDREPDTAMFVYEKIKSIIDSCKTTSQASVCPELCWMYSCRFPSHPEFYGLLVDHQRFVFDQLLDQKINKATNNGK